MHHYDYNCDCEDPMAYPPAKFISEFGFQTMPSFLSYNDVVEQEDWDVNSKLLSYRQRHENGNDQIQEQIEKHFILPSQCVGFSKIDK